MIIGIDLLWVKPKNNGGLESYIRNLLDGFQLYSPKDIKFVLFVSIDNHATFDKYFINDTFGKVICNVKSCKVYKRLIWENINLNRIGVKYNVNCMFVPVYSKPLCKTKEFVYVITIHDLQALHYPEYFSNIKNKWLRFAWKRCAETADKIVAISNFDKDDIINNLNINPDKIQVIYNPIVKTNEDISIEQLKRKYNIMEEQYFYTVSSMLPHKNLKTLLYLMKKIQIDDIDLPHKLVISGVGGKSKGELFKLINKLKIEESVVITGFVSDEERDCLYKNARAFLFPSIFEGFGMPPIEAMMIGTPVVCCSIEVIKEVTENRAIYVDVYKDVNEWVIKIVNALNKPANNHVEFKEYELKRVTEKYIKVFQLYNDEKI